MGKFDEAGVKLNQALKLDPDNQGAFYYLNLVKQANYAPRRTQPHDPGARQHGAGVGGVVAEGWHRIARAESLCHQQRMFTPALGGKSFIANWTPSGWIRFPGRQDGLPLSEVIHYLAEQPSCATDKKGINFIFNPNVEASSVPATGPGCGAGGAPVPLNANTGTGNARGRRAPPKCGSPAPSTSSWPERLSLPTRCTRWCWWTNCLNKYSVKDCAVAISVKPSGPEPPDT